MISELILPNERLDDLHCKGLFIIQDPKRFCFGVDAVLLSGFTKIKPSEQALDLCTGNGVIPILLSAKTKAKKLYGVEIQKESAELAKRSVLYNGLADRVEIFEADVKDLNGIFKPNSLDVITVNPPYMNVGAGMLNEYETKAVSRHEILCTFEDIGRTAQNLLKLGGRMYVVHRPNRLVDVITTLRRNNLEPKILRLVHPKLGKEPILVLIEAIKGGKPFLKVLQPLLIYEDNGEYTPEVYEIYYGNKE